MRTTVRLDERILREAKRLALGTGHTLTAVIEDALRESLARRRRAPARERIRLRTVAGRGLQPGVELDDSAGLRERMDEH